MTGKETKIASYENLFKTEEFAEKMSKLRRIHLAYSNMKNALKTNSNSSAKLFMIGNLPEQLKNIYNPSVAPSEPSNTPVFDPRIDFETREA
jgi:hypothetical protein